MVEKGFRILIADMDEQLVASNSKFLQQEGYMVATAYNEFELKNSAIVFRPHLMLIDFMSSSQLCRRVVEDIRGNSRLRDILIIILTGQAELVTDNVYLHSMIDGLIQKPVPPNELLAYVQMCLRRIQQPERDNMINYRDLIIDVGGYSVKRENDVIDMSKKEFELLLLLASEPRKVFSRKEISAQLWGDKVPENERILDVYIARLRQKIGRKYIQTLKGVGYSFTL